MAIPDYNSDLVDITTAESGTWGEIVGYTSGGSPDIDTDYFIQGTACYTQSEGGKTGLAVSMYFDYGSDLAASITSGKTIFFWQVILAGNAMETFVNGGLRLGVGSSSADFNQWISGGKDFGRNPYGGWQNIAIDPRYTPIDYTIGTPTAVWQFFCSHPNLVTAISKGNLHGVDAIRYGRGQLTISGGTVGDGYSTFTGLSTINDNISNRWGLFALLQGSFLWKGLLLFGNESNPTEFVDSNKVISIDDTPRTYLGFNRIEFYNTGSTISWNNIAISALGTLSPGQLEVIDDVDLTFDGCSFTNMDTFIFQSGSTVTNTIFQGCKEITSGGGVFTGTKVLESTVAADSSAISWNSTNNPDGYLDDMVFNKGVNAHHAIEFGTSAPTSITLRGITFIDFNTSDNQNDSVLYVAATGGTVTIQAVECLGTITYKSAGATVVITQGVVTKITVKDIISNAIIVGARVYLKVTDGSNFPYNTSVSITSSGTVATVTHADHGLITGDLVYINGVDSTTQDVYNGSKEITVTGLSGYTYVLQASTTSPATGTPTATFVYFNDLTNASGFVTDQRTLTNDQPVTGWVRKSTTSPLYQSQPISEIVDNVIGKEITILLVSDE